jgi:hypothetical protein
MAARSFVELPLIEETLRNQASSSLLVIDTVLADPFAE